MKKILLPLFALFLSVTTASAQIEFKKLGSAPVQTVHVANPANSAAVKKAPKKALADNQKYLYREGADTPVTAVGAPGNNVSMFFQELPEDFVSDYAGWKIVGLRYLTFVSADITPGVFYLKATSQGQGLYQGASASQSKTVASPFDEANQTFTPNWNETTFSSPYEIPEGTSELFIGFQYTQKNTKVGTNYTDDCYPFLVGASSDDDAYIYAYGNLGQGTGLYPYTTAYTMCAELIVESEGGIKDVVRLNNYRSQYCVKSGSKMFNTFSVLNTGKNSVSNYELAVSVDGKEVKTFSAPTVVTSNKTYTGIEFDAPAGLSAGKHNVSLTVKSVNGQAVENGSTMNGSFLVYNNSVDRQYNLVEQFTGEACGWCPLGYQALRQVVADKPNTAWVGVHNYQAKQGDDEYVFNNSGYISQFAMTYLPSAAINRFYYGDSFNGKILAYGLSYGANGVSQVVSNVEAVMEQSETEVPSFVTLDMKSSYDKTTGKITVTVNGTGTSEAAQLLSDATVTVYVTQNGLKGSQLSYLTGKEQTLDNYDHENVLRAILSKNPWGDQITWNGNTFTMKFEATAEKTWKDGDLDAVAFVSKPFVVSEGGKNYYGDVKNAWVDQCVKQHIEGTATGIEGVQNTNNTTVVARYALDGTKISAPVKGINILKMSDGTTRKVVVNK